MPPTQAKHPVLVIQDPKGQLKPIYSEFVPRHGRSTWMMLMLGHPDDVPGGPLISSEVRAPPLPSSPALLARGTPACMLTRSATLPAICRAHRD